MFTFLFINKWGLLITIVLQKKIYLDIFKWSVSIKLNAWIYSVQWFLKYLYLIYVIGSSEADKVSREIPKQAPQCPDDGWGQAGTVSYCMFLSFNFSLNLKVFKSKGTAYINKYIVNYKWVSKQASFHRLSMCLKFWLEHKKLKLFATFVFWPFRKCLM